MPSNQYHTVNKLSRNGLWSVYSLDGVTLRKEATASKHFLRIPPAIAVDREIFEEAVEQGAEYVQVYEKESGLYYTATVEQFQKRGFHVNRGYGAQVALLLKEWNRSENPEIPRKERKTRYAEQATLF